MKVALGTATSPKVVKTVTVGKTGGTITSPKSVKRGNSFRVGGRGVHAGSRGGIEHSPTMVVPMGANTGVGLRVVDVSKLTVDTWSSIGITSAGAVLRLVVLGGRVPTLSREDSTDGNGEINRSQPRLEKGTSLFSIALNSAWALLQSVARWNTNGVVVMDGTSARQGTEGVGFDSFGF